MTGAQDPGAGDAITALVDLALESVRGESARLFLWDGDRLRQHTARSNAKEHLRGQNRQAAAIAERVVRSRKALIIIDLPAPTVSGEFFMIRDMWPRLALVVVMAAPLRRGNRILGALYVDAKAWDREFTDADLRVLEATADRLATALEGDAGAQGHGA